jgi:3-phytase
MMSGRAMPRTWSLLALAVVGWVVATLGAGPPQGREAPVTPVHVEVTAVGETPDVRGTGDVADDPAIWTHPDDPASGRILGTSKDDTAGGLHVYDLEGSELQFLPAGQLNSVDVRYGLPGLGDYAAASNRTANTIDVFGIAPDGTVATAGRIALPEEPYGLCLGVTPDAHVAVVTFKSGEFRQYRLSAQDGEVEGVEVRAVRVGSSQLEGCAADDARGLLYVGEEDAAVYAYGLDPEAGDTWTVVDSTNGGNLVADIEGITIHRDGAGGGFLLVSSQGASRIDVYDRVDHVYYGSFRVEAGAVTGEVTETDGLAVSSVPQGEFEDGLLVLHDGERRDAPATNYKLVRWDDVAHAMGLDAATTRQRPAAPTR